MVVSLLSTMSNSSLTFPNQSYHGFATLGKDFLRLNIIFPILGTSILILFLTCKSKLQAKSQRRSLPPGLTPWPIVGNLPEVWRNKPTFRWILGLMKELNTEIACIRIAGVHVIPVTSPELAREFLKKNDAMFASRPITMASEYASRGFKSVIFTPWGDQWKKMKKVVASEIINSATHQRLLNKRNEEADNLVWFIYNQSKNTLDDVNSIGSVVNVRLATHQYCGNVIKKLLFNKRYFGKGSSDGGPRIEEVEYIESLFTVIVHLYSFAVSDYISCLRPLDLDGHEQVLHEAMRILTKHTDEIINERLQQWKHGKKKEADDLLDAFILAKDSNGKPELSAEEIKAEVTELMLAAVDNPSNCVEWAMAEMLKQPEILQKAIEEIDRVVGKERWVQETDVPQLNYVKACAREAFRLHPIAPFNLPHVAMQDMTIAGYFIPKGSHVILSRYGLGRNPRVWEEPIRFIPERHFNKDGSSANQKVELAEHELRFISFSTGRRGCMAITLGSVMTVMPFARLLQGFSWSLPLNGELDLSESKHDLCMATPLVAYAKPRLATSLYPTSS